ncbi:hypothetical protein BH10CHL1_BH10CHL1_14960 [soil metagenome]
MVLVSSQQAGHLLDVTSQTMRAYARGGVIPFTPKGLKGIYRFDLDDLRKFAQATNPHRYFDHKLATEIEQSVQK